MPIDHPTLDAQMMGHMRDMRDGLDQAAHAWIDMEIFLGDNELDFGDEKTVQLVLEVFNSCVNSLETLAWVTGADAVKDRPEWREYRRVTRDRVNALMGRLVWLLNHRERD